MNWSNNSQTSISASKNKWIAHHASRQGSANRQPREWISWTILQNLTHHSTPNQSRPLRHRTHTALVVLHFCPENIQNHQITSKPWQSLHRYTSDLKYRINCFKSNCNRDKQERPAIFHTEASMILWKRSLNSPKKINHQWDRIIEIESSRRVWILTRWICLYQRWALKDRILMAGISFSWVSLEEDEVVTFTFINRFIILLFN